MTPDVDVELRPVTDDDADFLYRLNEAAMRVYAEQTFGQWDETVQRRIFAEGWSPATTRIVVVDGQDIGMLQVFRREAEVHLSNVRLLPAYQGKGVGTRLISDVLQDAHGRGQPVTLSVFKVNPARRLYERLGFVLVSEDEQRYHMVAPPPA